MGAITEQWRCRIGSFSGGRCNQDTPKSGQFCSDCIYPTKFCCNPFNPCKLCKVCGVSGKICAHYAPKIRNGAFDSYETLLVQASASGVFIPDRTYFDKSNCGFKGCVNTPKYISMSASTMFCETCIYLVSPDCFYVDYEREVLEKLINLLPDIFTDTCHAFKSTRAAPFFGYAPKRNPQSVSRYPKIPIDPVSKNVRDSSQVPISKIERDPMTSKQDPKSINTRDTNKDIQLETKRDQHNNAQVAESKNMRDPHLDLKSKIQKDSILLTQDPKLHTMTNSVNSQEDPKVNTTLDSINLGQDGEPQNMRGPISPTNSCAEPLPLHLSGGGPDVTDNLHSTGYNCRKCHKTLKSRQGRSKHEKRCGSMKSQGIIYPQTCICGNVSKSLTALLQHRKICKEESLQLDDQRPAIEKNLIIKAGRVNKKCIPTHRAFGRWNEFDAWKNGLERETGRYYTQDSGPTKRINREYHYYTCQFNFNPRSHTKVGQPFRLTPRKLHCGVIENLHCPARIVVHVVCGTLHVYLYDNHEPHPVRDDKELTKRHYFPTPVQDKAIKQISLGVPPRKVYQNLMNQKWNIGHRQPDLPLEKSDQLTTKYCSNLRYKHQKIMEPCKEEIANVVYLINSFEQENTPFLFFKPQGCDAMIGDKESLKGHKQYKNLFVLAWQSPEQLDMMAQQGQRIVFHDSTHKTNRHKFKLINGLVQDERGRGYPVYHIITNVEDVVVVTAVLKEMKKKKPDITINAVMSDDDRVAGTAYRIVFGPHVKHYLCYWHVARTWYRHLTALHAVIQRDPLRELDIDRLHLMLRFVRKQEKKEDFDLYMGFLLDEYHETFPEFTTYFKNMYMDRIEEWAKWARIKIIGDIDTNLIIESFHNQLKTYYLERRGYGTIYTLLRYIMQIDIEAYKRRNVELRTTTLSQEKKSAIQIRHARGLQIPDSQVISCRINKKPLWYIKSVRENSLSYEVEPLNDTCPINEHCTERCSSLACLGLCAHLYTCTCPDYRRLGGICKHIHKVYSMQKIYKKRDSSHMSAKAHPLSPKVPKMQESDDSASRGFKIVPDASMLPSKIKILPNEKLQKQMCITKTAKKSKTKQPFFSSAIPEAYQSFEEKFRLLAEKHSQGWPNRVSIFHNLPAGFNTNYGISENPLSFIPLPSCRLTNTLPTCRFVTYKELLTLDPTITQQHVKKFPGCEKTDDFNAGWLFDNVVFEFLTKLIVEKKFGGTHRVLDPHAASQVWSDRGNITNKQYRNYYVVFCALVINNNHWVLLICDRINKRFIYLNSTGRNELTHEKIPDQVKQIMTFLDDGQMSDNVSFPPSVQQIDAYNCGIFVCYYVEQFLLNQSLMSDFDTLEYRKKMFKTLCSAS